MFFSTKSDLRIPPEVAQTLGSGAQRVELVITRQRVGSEADVAVREKTTFMVPR